MTDSIYYAAILKIQEFFPDCDNIEHATLDSLHVDSFLLIQITLALETAFELEFEDATFEPGAFQTLGQIAHYVEKKALDGSSKTSFA